MRIDVIDNVTPKMEKLPLHIKNRITQKLVEIVTFVQERAIEHAYEDNKYGTGKLASAIRVNVNEGRAWVTADRRVAKHVPYVEYGTKYMKGKFYMERAGVDARFIAPGNIVEGIRLAFGDSGLKSK